MNKYIILEIGDSAYTAFRLKNGEFDETDDAILVDEIEANSKKEAYDKVINKPEHRNKMFSCLVIRQVI